jgi:hypothetical protein
MATIFISYSSPDASAAGRLERYLLEKGHRVRIHVGAAVAGNWRTKFARGLIASDVFVVLVSEAALTSKNVLGEIGAARVLYEMRGMLMLPVLVGSIDFPDLVNDMYCFKLKADTDQAAAETADGLDKAIADEAKLAPRVFISHRHIDKPIATELVALLEQAFDIAANDLRCTSVKPYMLTPGERTSEQLRSDIARAELVIGILSPDTSESNYVLCELGASWGRDVPTFPVLARGASFADVPSPLNERHSLSLEDEGNCLDLIEYVASKTSLRRKDVMPGRLSDYAKRLANAAKLATRASGTSA